MFHQQLQQLHQRLQAVERSPPASPLASNFLRSNPPSMSPSSRLSKASLLPSASTLVPSASCSLARPSRIVFDFSEEYLSQFYHVSQKDAAKLIGVAVITVKRVCKRLGINWPYRAEKLRLQRQQRAIRRLIANERRRRLAGESEAARRFARLPLECMEANNEVDEDEVGAEEILRSLALAKTEDSTEC